MLLHCASHHRTLGNLLCTQTIHMHSSLYSSPACAGRHYRCHKCSRSSSSSSMSKHVPNAIFSQPANDKRDRNLSRTSPAAFATRQAGPKDIPPNYSSIDSQPLNQVIMALFRNKMVAAIGADSKLTGYEAIIDLTRSLNSAFPDARQVQLTTRGILNSLFPSWLPGAFKVLFSRPLPDFSCRLNAAATALTCQWLMGPCKINDVELDDGRVGKGMGVLVERCRYLEQSGCASICINSCKVPTQICSRDVVRPLDDIVQAALAREIGEFFEKDMGLPLTMTPNYEDFSCQFAFGKTPLPQSQDEAFSTFCFQQCPSKAARFADCRSSSSNPSSSSSGGGGGGGNNCSNIISF